MNNLKGQVLQVVVFVIDGVEHAVDIMNVQEINRIKEITRVPNSPDYIEGVINLRGKIIPIINLRKKFGFVEKEPDDTSRVIIMDIQGAINGIIVDSVSEVLRIPADMKKTAPAEIWYAEGVIKLEDVRVVIFIDLDKLFPELPNT